MLFNSFEFLFVFLPIVVIVYFFIFKGRLVKYANLWLVFSSLFFYAYYKVEYLPIIISSILFNYIMGRLINKVCSRKIKKLLFVFSVIGNLSLLCFYKYFNFLIETFNTISLSHFNTMKIMLPLGISFFTFQQISYIYDIYKGEAKQTNITDYTLFVSFFPQLIAGPICTFKELIPQFEDISRKVINRENIYRGFFLITIGLFKKVIFADNFTEFIRDYMLLESSVDFCTSWAFALSVAIQGYFDFSGYCDMAMGIAALFNIVLPINFDSPYKSLDISDYWRRWHITMGRFLKYQVYIPMGGSRKGELRTYFNLFFVFLVTGIWHGANWTCILYGILNGIFVCINKLWKKTNIQINRKLAILITFSTMVLIAPLVMLKHVHQYFFTVKSMLGIKTEFLPVLYDDFNFLLNNNNYKLNAILFISSLIIIFCFKNSNELVEKYIKSNNVFYTFVISVIFVVSVLSLTKGSEFIYFNF